jgi:hypothetical protein
MNLKDNELLSGLVGPEVPPLLAAAYARVSTALSFTRMLTPLGNYFIARPVAKAVAHTITAKTAVPLDAAVVLALSADALHVWGADPVLNQVHDHLGHVPLGRITSLTAIPGRTWQPLTITLDGGHQIKLEARGAVHQVVAEFDKLRAHLAQP